MAIINKLNDIGDAIRNANGTSGLETFRNILAEGVKINSDGTPNKLEYDLSNYNFNTWELYGIGSNNNVQILVTVYPTLADMQNRTNGTTTSYPWGSSSNPNKITGTDKFVKVEVGGRGYSLVLTTYFTLISNNEFNMAQMANEINKFKNIKAINFYCTNTKLTSSTLTVSASPYMYNDMLELCPKGALLMTRLYRLAGFHSNYPCALPTVTANGWTAIAQPGDIWSSYSTASSGNYSQFIDAYYMPIADIKEMCNNGTTPSAVTHTFTSYTYSGTTAITVYTSFYLIDNLNHFELNNDFIRLGGTTMDGNKNLTTNKYPLRLSNSTYAMKLQGNSENTVNFGLLSSIYASSANGHCWGGYTPTDEASIFIPGPTSIYSTSQGGINGRQVLLINKTGNTIQLGTAMNNSGYYYGFRSFTGSYVEPVSS